MQRLRVVIAPDISLADLLLLLLKLGELWDQPAANRLCCVLLRAEAWLIHGTRRIGVSLADLLSMFHNRGVWILPAAHSPHVLLPSAEAARARCDHGIKRLAG